MIYMLHKIILEDYHTLRPATRSHPSTIQRFFLTLGIALCCVRLLHKAYHDLKDTHRECRKTNIPKPLLYTEYHDAKGLITTKLETTPTHSPCKFKSAEPVSINDQFHHQSQHEADHESDRHQFIMVCLSEEQR